MRARKTIIRDLILEQKQKVKIILTKDLNCFLGKNDNVSFLFIILTKNKKIKGKTNQS